MLPGWGIPPLPGRSPRPMPLTNCTPQCGQVAGGKLPRPTSLPHFSHFQTFSNFGPPGILGSGTVGKLGIAGPPPKFPLPGMLPGPPFPPKGMFPPIGVVGWGVLGRPGTPPPG